MSDNGQETDTRSVACDVDGNTPRTMDALMQTCGLEEQMHLSSQELDWKTVNRKLSHPELNSPSCFVPMENFGEDLMKIPIERYDTMDAASKCFETITRDADDLLTTEIDGGTWVMVAPCVAQIPPQITDALYFFHMLLISVTNLKHYAIPTNKVSLRRQPGDKTSISNMIWHKQIQSYRAPSQDVSNTPLDISKMLSEMYRITDDESTIPIAVQPFKIRVGFTGALFEHAGMPHRKMFCVLAVTWSRNFDIWGFIKGSLLKEPVKTSPHYKQRVVEFQRLNHIWNDITSAAFDNLNIPKSELGTPRDHKENRTGPLGVDMLFNMFMIPLQIHGIIRREIHNKMRRNEPGIALESVGIENLQIIGMPPLSFMTDEVTVDYTRYMQNYVITMGDDYQLLQKYIRQHYKPKPKEKKEEEPSEEADISEGRIEAFTLPCPGGWPLEAGTGEDEQVCYTKWGLPRLPVWLSFAPMNVPDASMSQENWKVFIGDMPALVRALLRGFLVQDLNAPQEIQDQMWDYFLKDKRKVRPTLILSEYYGERADPLAPVLTAGRMRPWWIGLKMNLTAQRERGAYVDEIFGGLQRYLQESHGAILFHRSSIAGGAYRSNRVQQALEVLESLDMGKVCRGMGGKQSSTEAFLAKLIKNISKTREYDQYARANEGFWKGFEELNKSFMMNSNNLEFMVELMITQVMWMISAGNEDIAGYFQCIKQVSGNGHFIMTTPNGSWPDDRKPNSTGMDWTLAMLMSLNQMLMDEAGFCDPKQNLQGPANLTTWTPASLVYAIMATMVNGAVVSLPDPNYVMRDMVATELRGDNMDGLIKNVIQRNSDDQQQIAMNTGDPSNTNLRVQMVRKKVSTINLGAMASNVPNMKPEEAERAKTLLLVTAAMPPGAGPPKKKHKTGELNHMATNVHGGRGVKPENEEGFANFLVLPHMWAITIPALMNQAGFIPFKKAPSSVAFLDWIFLYVQEYSEGMIGKWISESFKRIKEGYEARQVAKSLWTKSEMYLSSCKNEEETSIKILMSMITNALPVQDVIPTVHCFLTRGLHMGALIMISCIAQHLRVPILRIESLRELFESDSVPDSGEALDTYNAVRTWLLECIEKHRFCPETQSTSHTFETMSPYITSDGNSEGLPPPNGDTLLRLNKSNVPHEVHHAVGKRIKEIWGGTLFQTCSMGPEVCIYSNAIQDLMTQWAPDFRRLISNHVFSSARLLTRMSLNQQVHGCTDWPPDSDRPPPFAKQFRYFRGDEVIAQAVGIHWSSLLLCVSMMGGPTLHSKVTSDFARSFLVEILRHSPPCATPGDNILVRSFNLHTTAVERIIVPKRIPRPPHFLRPKYDNYFADTGVYSYTRAMGRFAPEDCMHCGFLFEYATLYSCDIMELPAHAVLPEYEIMPNEYYSIWRNQDQSFGVLRVETQESKVLITFTNNSLGDESHVITNFHTWQDDLASNGFIITPMIWRSGAAIQTRGAIGVLVPAEGTTSNFDHNGNCYHVLSEQDSRPRRVGFAKTLQNLIPLGTEVYVNLRSQAVQALALKLSRADAAKDLLVGRLNVPTAHNPTPGKLYVSCIQRPILANNNCADQECHTLAVDPWDLCLEAQEGKTIARQLVL